MRIELGPTFAAICALLLGATLALGSGCVREHTLLQELAGPSAGEAGAGGSSLPEAGRAGSDGGLGGGGVGGSAGSDEPAAGPPWDKAQCVAALSAGKNGQECVGDFSCSATTDCCDVKATCKVGALFLETTCNDCQVACTVDADCATGNVCEAYRCLTCPAEPCPTDWVYVLRNDCKVCVPPSECRGDEQCPDGRVCVAGLACLPGCKADPNCCFGNRCVAPDCGSPSGVDCAVVGCAAGTFCEWTGSASACDCSPENPKWLCSPSALNQCAKR